MRGDGAAIERRSGFYVAMSFAVSFHHSPSALGRYYLNRAAIARGTGELCGDGPIAALRTFYFKLFYCVSSSCIL